MNSNTQLRLATAAALLACMVVSAGCRSKKDEEMINPNMTSTGTGVENPGGESLPNVDSESLLFGPSGLQAVYFDFDSYDLRPDALSTLRDNADKIRQTPGVIIQIEGHCDERGTQEYNLALGERRALATRAHLMNLGVSGDRLITISYGEEDPAMMGSNESAWAQNRRCEFNRAM